MTAEKHGLFSFFASSFPFPFCMDYLRLGRRRRPAWRDGAGWGCRPLWCSRPARPPPSCWRTTATASSAGSLVLRLRISEPLLAQLSSSAKVWGEAYLKVGTNEKEGRQEAVYRCVLVSDSSDGSPFVFKFCHHLVTPSQLLGSGLLITAH